jgi:hypothetical protein
MRQAPHDDARIFDRPPLDEPEEPPEVNAEDDQEEEAAQEPEVPMETILQRLLESIPTRRNASLPSNVLAHIRSLPGHTNDNPTKDQAREIIQREINRLQRDNH